MTTISHTRPKIKICIWMNVKTHHQNAFFDAIAADSRFDLQVRYFATLPEELLTKGYDGGIVFTSYEKSVSCCNSPREMIKTVPDWRERIHISGYSFCPELIHFFAAEKARWCQWSERSGYKLFTLLRCNLFLWKLLSPLYFYLKRAKINFINHSAHRVFCAGRLSSIAFESMGIDRQKIFPLYYATKPLPVATPPDDLINWAKGKRIFVYVGELSQTKATDILLKAFSKLSGVPSVLLLVGPDRGSGRYHKIADRLGISQRVKFTGAVKSSAVSAYMSMADVVLLPSRLDGWGVVLNEAASLGKALIATDQCGGAWHVIHQGENGFRIPAGSVSALTQSMQKYVDDPALHKKHGRLSKDVYFSEFTPQCNVERLFAGLRENGA